MKKEMLKIAKAFLKKHKAYPTMTDLISLGIKRTTMRDQFGNLDGLHDALYEECKELIFDLNREKSPDFNRKDFKRYIITTATTGDVVDKQALKSLRSYCKKMDAKLLIHVARGSGKLGQTLDPSLRGEYICLNNLGLNSNVKLISVFQSGAKVDPTSGGVSRVGKRDSTIILASPKQRLLYTATGIHSLPHAGMGTGSITYPNYESSKLSGYVADHDHVMGAVVVEIQNDSMFHFRQVQFDEAGRFVDLGLFFDGKTVSKMAPSAMVLGDWHSGKTCPMVKKASFAITKALGIKEWVLHDAYDSTSNNHHEMGKLLLLSKKASKQELDLTKELTGLAKDLEDMVKVVNVTVVKSNHDEFLDRYLDSGAWIKHPYNTELCLELASAVMNGFNPVEYAVTKFASKDITKVTWLERDESYKIAGIECGSHGDKGPNGSRGSIVSIERSYDKCVFGHSHTPGILRGAWQVGTSTLPYPDYGTGPSSWMNTHCLIYPNGQRQLINFLEGSWTI